MIDTNILREFEDALRGREIIPPEGGPVVDGKIHRANTGGRNGKGDASYCLYGDEPVAGWFENHQDGLGVQTWKANGSGRKPSEAERAKWVETKKAREADRVREQEQAAKESRQVWNEGKPADPAHPYLTRKKIPPEALRQDADGNLLVPMQDTTGTIRNVQRIFPDGTKRFQSGASTTGLFYQVGLEPEPDDQVVIVEGIADAISVFRSTGRRTYAAMSGPNLLDAGRAVRRQHPETRIVYFADHDKVNERTGKRPGIEKANEAARRTGGKVIMSPVEDEDPNDVYLRGGEEAVRKILDTAAGEPAAEQVKSTTVDVIQQGKRSLPFHTVTPEKLVPPSGFLREYVDTFTEQTDAPLIYHLMMGYLTVAAAVGAGTYFMLAGDRLYPNLWINLIGPSSISRKSTALGKSRRTIRAVAPNAILPSDFSIEALIKHLADNPQGVFYHLEFRSFYGLLSKDYNAGAKALLTELYDCPPEHKQVRVANPLVIRRPIISIASGTTTEWLTQKNSDSDFGSGFLARFLFVPSFVREKSIPLPGPPDRSREDALAGNIRTIMEQTATITEAMYDPMARDTYIDWHNKYDKILPFEGTPLGPFHARYQSYVHKLAMLYTISVGGDLRRMDMVAITYATATIEWITRELARLHDRYLTFNRDDERMKKVLDCIPEDGKYITQSDLLRRTRIKVRDLEELLGTLAARGDIKSDRHKINGQNARVYCRIM